MGSVFKARCEDCGHAFEASDAGGGFTFIQLRCDKCGVTRGVKCPDRRGTAVRWTSEHEAEWERWRRELESMDVRCPCGGEFTESAPLRCPKCGSTDIAKGETVLCYD